MKKINHKIIFVMLFFAVIACDTITPEPYNGKFFMAFETPELSIDEDDGTIEIPVLMGATKSDTDVTINYEVASNDNAVGLYTIESEGTVTVPAGETIGYIVLTPTDNSIFDGEKTLTFTLTGSSRSDLIIGFDGPDKLNSTLSVTINDNDCPFGDISEWTGAYDVTMTLSFGFIFAAGTYTDLDATLTVGPNGNTLVDPDFGFLSFSGRTPVPVTINLDPEALSTNVVGTPYNFSNGTTENAVYAYGTAPNERVYTNDDPNGLGFIATCTKTFTVKARIKRQDGSTGQILLLTYKKL